MNSVGLSGFQSELTKYSVSTIPLVVANVIPLFGVLFLGWSTFALVSLYWAENVVIGVVNVLKMITSNPDATAGDLEGFLKGKSEEQQKADLEKLAGQERMLQLFHHLAKLFLIPFFVFHYGAFCVGHGLFISILLGGEAVTAGNPFEAIPELFQAMIGEGLFLALAALAASHLASYFSNFLYRGEYRRTFAMTLMTQPYGRVVALHLTILLGAFAIAALGQTIWMLVILVAAKTVLDLKLHLREREKNSKSSETSLQKTAGEQVIQRAEAT